MAQALRSETLRTEIRSTEVRPAEEVSLRIEAAGYGGVPLRAVVPAEALSGIEKGTLPVETDLEIKVPGYGWRVTGVRVFPRNEESVPGDTRPVLLSLPGYGSTPLGMTFLGRAR